MDHVCRPGAPRDLAVVVRPLSQLKTNPRNARTHSRRQVRQIADSIRTFGFNNPILIDDEGLIIAGHGRIAAAELLSMTEVPTVCLSHMSEAEKRAYIIADNRLAEKAGWDFEILAIEFKVLFEIAPELDLDDHRVRDRRDRSSYRGARSERRAGCARRDRAPDGDAVPVTEPGDLWLLGPHRILCGDATDAGLYDRLLDGEPAQMVFTDPPYNVAIGGNVTGLGRVRHREFAMASGEMTEDEYTAFLTGVLEQIGSQCADGAIAFVCMDWRHLYELLGAGRAAKLTLKNLCVWAKTNAGMGTFYRSQHELVAVFKIGAGSHINSFELGQHGRRRTNVWTYPGVNAFGAGRDAAITMHPTVKPVALVADAIRDCSKRNGLVLDPFLGSGTTVIAAEVTGRRAAGIELDPLYVDCAVRRWEKMTGKSASLAATGETFAVTALARGEPKKEVVNG